MNFRFFHFQFVTAIVIIAICCFAVERGLNIAFFSFIDAGIIGDRTKAARYWTETPGLSSAAREASLAGINLNDPESVLKRRSALIYLLTANPMSSMRWLNLSNIHLLAGDGIAKIVSAFEFSALTGPREGNVMVQRGLFGLSLWELFPPKYRIITIRDVIGTFVSERIVLSELDKVRLDKILSIKAENIRQEFRDALEANGVSRKDVKNVVGF